MRDRIIRELRRSAEGPPAERDRWRALRDRLGEIAISTIDAFCLSLLREFPLEADLDPGFGMTDETEAPRLVQQALDRTLAVCGAVAVDDPAVAMVLARLGAGRVRTALGPSAGAAAGGAGGAAAVSRVRAPRVDGRGRVPAGGGSARPAPGGRRRRSRTVSRGRSDRPPPVPGPGAGAPRPRRAGRVGAGLAASAARPDPRVLSDRGGTAAPAIRAVPGRPVPVGGGVAAALRPARSVAPAVAEALAALVRDLNVVLARGCSACSRFAVTELRAGAGRPLGARLLRGAGPAPWTCCAA